MLYVHSPVAILRTVAALTFFLAVGALWLGDPDAARALLGLKGFVLAGPAALVFLLTVRPVFHIVHRTLGAGHWWFPLLDGVWEGEAHSNWPRIQALMEAARHDAPAFDALSDPLAAGASIPVTATIRSGLLDYSLTLRISGTRKSETIFVRPTWMKPEAPRLAYLYEQCEDAAVEVSDVRVHRGAAILSYDLERDTLSGEYWTQRQAIIGLNTAGSLILRRAAKA